MKYDSDCRYKLGQYADEENGKKQCITAEECISAGKFINGDSCLTAAQCENQSSYTKYYAYKPINECLSIEPNKNGGFISTTDNIYDCGSNYLDITGSRAKCVSKKACEGLIYDSEHLCLTEEKC